MAELPDESSARKAMEPYDLADEYGVSEPVERPRVLPPAPSSLRTGLRAEAAEREPRTEPGRFPFFAGIFDFFLYPRTIAAWLLMSLGMTITALGFVLCIWLLEVGLLIAARCFAMPVALIGLLSFSYAAACCLKVIEVTAAGYDEVEEWPSGLWRDWVWILIPAAVMLALAMAAGSIAAGLLSLPSWVGIGLGAHLLFPVFLVSSLESGSATTFVSWTALRGFVAVWWAWGLFYIETGVLLALWGVATVAAFPLEPFLTTLVAMPILGAVALVYSRLVGRLLWCYAQAAERGHGG